MGELPLFNALKHRNFRLYLSGQFVSLIGTWMQQLATSWMVYRLTNSPLWLGIAAFSSMVPTFLFGLLAGVIVDRSNRHKLLIWTQSLAAVQAFVLAFLALTGKANLWELIVLNFALGVVNAVDMPTRQAFVVQMISGKKDLPNAIALSSSVMNGTRLIGPAIAGVTIATVGEGMCFLLNGVSYVAVLIALILMRFESIEKVELGQENLMQSLQVGFHSAFRFPPIRTILLYLAFTSFFGMPYNTLFPALAAGTLGGGAGALGTITAAVGFGALAGALYLARRKDIEKMGRLLGRSGLLFGVGLIAVAYARSFPVMAVFLFFSGLGMMIQLACSNTVIQTLVEDDKRGRVMSFFTFSLLGAAPFGSLLIGWLAQRIGVSNALRAEGVLCILGSMLYLTRTSRLNVYVPTSVRASVF